PASPPPRPAAPVASEEDEDKAGDVGPEDVPWGQGTAADEEMPSYLQAPPEEAVDYEFDGDWQALVTELGVKLGAARMLAHNAVLKDWSQHGLALAVPESFRHMTSRDYQDKLKLALRERFGRPVELTVTVEELGLETPAMKDARHRQEQLDIARENMKNDPVVQQMVREFDATLLIETIQPVKE
ncbi:DNA polymerase III subunit gamma/tau, partial [Chromobacterium aquaticum]|nr:DNA polymerase III subunit gamma/tau [Chromobacterium aquaticum]